MLKFVFITLAIGHVMSQQTLQVTDYCDSGLCKSPKHITCEMSAIQEKAASGCARILPLDDEAKQAFVDAHNKKRNLIAGGEQPRFQSATKMSTVEWDQTLADYALLNVMRCDFAHDCHSLPDMKFSGQNIAGDHGEDLKKIAYSAVENWYKEVDDSTQENIDNCCDLKVGHFTQVVQARNNRIGCAVGIIPYNGDQMTYIVCNYAFGNLAGKAYISGPPASGCKSGSNPQYPALCSSAEQVDANDGH
ncbi:venom allergen-1-like [Chironomus tepperi]|uniref:venom allergen-1-like n=1 Tax=Chironomus tepperi TaxID=113505 RepID=UPI00391F5122